MFILKLVNKQNIRFLGSEKLNSHFTRTLHSPKVIVGDWLWLIDWNLWGKIDFSSIFIKNNVNSE